MLSCAHISRMQVPTVPFTVTAGRVLCDSRIKRGNVHGEELLKIRATLADG